MEPALAPSWTERILDVGGATGGATDAAWAREGQRLAVAIGLASLFGIAIGLRAGGVAIATHAFGVSLGIVAVCGLAVPALAIILALVNASLRYLSDLEPAGFVETPLIGGSLPQGLQRDRGWRHDSLEIRISAD